MLSRIPIRLRLTLAFTVAMAAVFAAMSAFVYARVDRALTASLDRDLELQAREVRSHVESDRGLLDPDTAPAASLAQLSLPKHGAHLLATRALASPFGGGCRAATSSTTRSGTAAGRS